jgi:hypothetical protein
MLTWPDSRSIIRFTWLQVSDLPHDRLDSEVVLASEWGLPMRAETIARVIVLAGLLLIPRGAWAQSTTTGAIAGAVRDTTGAVLSGVTVEAASPAVIEKVRTVVTDHES